ncbi:hypothetical protein NDU88_003982 [Pleurodeles waltl]|uniref:Uncharacterized protein n=1 Tax=Pleurodeles waltl TaxID=8319 RepID=A0AAV7RI63_PLEWA|nr:hypothetical protein NDU88_003982 [Pleurodeles waltl]
MKLTLPKLTDRLPIRAFGTTDSAQLLTPWGKPQSRSGRAVEDTAKLWCLSGARLRGSGEGWRASELSARRALCSRGLRTRVIGETGIGAAWQATSPGLEGAHRFEGVPRACRRDAKRDPTWTRRAGPKETQQQGGGRRRWVLNAGQSAPRPDVGAERTRGLTLRTHKSLPGLHRGTGGVGGGTDH